MCQGPAYPRNEVIDAPQPPRPAYDKRPATGYTPATRPIAAAVQPQARPPHTGTGLGRGP